MTERPPGSSTSDLVQSLTADLGALVRQEIERAQQELGGKARRAGRAGAYLGAAAALGTMAAGSSTVLLMRLLDRRLSPTTSAALATALYAASAGALTAGALTELRRAWPLVPEATVAGLRDDVRVATDTAGPPPA